MILHACRIVVARHAPTAFSGDGAEIFGGRWNSRGIPVVYTSCSAALAMLEMLVHLKPRELLKSYVLFPVSFDKSLVESVALSRLPRNWRDTPPPTSTQQMGDHWLTQAKSPVLRVPSAVVPAEYNYVLNPSHPDFRKITIGPRTPLKFDPRLSKTPH
jgi:RES domain-containing protein